MPTTTSLSAIRAARFTIQEDSLEGLQIRILDQPFGNAINRFKQDINDESRHKAQSWIPDRRLNKALVAISPTLTYGNRWNSAVKGYQALAVGVPILVGANHALLDDFPTATTLVQLDTYGNIESADWDDRLSDFLTSVGARTLVKPHEIFANPHTFWLPAGQNDFEGDEYYVVHAEGYKYGEGRGREHQIMPEFSLTEINEVIGEILKHLPLLKSDNPIAADIPAPSGQKKPYPMRNIGDLGKPTPLNTKDKTKFQTQEAIQEERTRRTIESRRKQQPIIAEAIQRALLNEPVQISILWHNEDTRDALLDSLRDLFLLNQADLFPSCVNPQNPSHVTC